jgi:hypothetical protein
MQMRNSRSVAAYLRFILEPFFRWWWVLITGIASFLSYVLTPDKGWELHAAGALAVTLAIFTFGFLALSVIIQGWPLFHERDLVTTVESVQKNPSFGSDWVFVLGGEIGYAPGTVLEILRKFNGLEIPFAMVTIRSSTLEGRYIAVPVWLSPAHLRDYSAGELPLGRLIVRSQIQLDRAIEVLNGLP